MFYHGSLQEGIATAVQRNKTVVCFVTDEQEESKLWENEFLVDDEIADILHNEAIALRLAAGSEEAGYLAAIFPLPKTPTLVILKNGELKEYISAGTTKEVFMQRTLNSFGRKRKPTPEPATSSPTSEQSAASIIAAALSAASSPVIRASSSRGPSPPPPYSTSQLSQTQTQTLSSSESAPSNQDTQADTQPPTQSSPALSPAQQILAERAARLTAQRAEEDRKARDSKPSPSSSSDPAPAPPASLTPQQSDHASSINRQRNAQLAEKKRILQQIEDDKLARRQRAADRSAAKLTPGAVATALASAPSSSISRSSNDAMAALQVRLQDGTSLRSRFSRDTTLAGDVRDWVSRERAAKGLPDSAYQFKLVLTPQPNRLLDGADEDKPLHAIGLTPSATLVLVSTSGASSAYANTAAGAGGPLSYILAFFAWISALLCTFLGIGGPARTDDSSTDQTGGADSTAVKATGVGRRETYGGAVAGRQLSAEDLHRRRQQVSGSSSVASGSRIRGFEQQRMEPGEEERNAQRGEQHQLYNGNSTNFEPRPDDDDQ
ncbi:UBX domain protein [Ceratocystis lukuohia]|uniref:UBX domain-containing protein 2 n=1 Tax=Ceratocystis lukuohia TaxID=2019550 RepID=A0ABR4M9E4_9PEZI